MTDPIGTLGVPRSAPESDLSLASRGGAKFMERLQQMATARDEYDAAFERLQIGSNIKELQAEAQRKLADAEKLRVQADQIKGDADRYATETKTKSDAVIASAKEEVVNAQRQRAQAEALIAQYKAAKAETERATKAANDRHPQLQSKIDRLHSIINEVGA